MKREITIDWKCAQTWSSMLDGWIAQHLERDALGPFQGIGEVDLYDDDSEWLDILQEELSLSIGPLIDNVASRLSASVLRTYHACRPIDTRSYFKDGIKRHKRSALITEAREIIDSHPEFSWLNGRFEERLEIFDSELREGRVFLATDDRSILKYAGHYLIYGSEWISSLIGEGFRDLLKDRGIPTFIEVDLPLNLFDHCVRKEFAESLLIQWVRRKYDSNAEIVILDFSFTCDFDVEPSLITGHYHPRRIRDCLLGFEDYEAPQTSCELCAIEATDRRN